MSDEENSEINKRFNKFESSVNNNSYMSGTNCSMKRTKSYESMFINNPKRIRSSPDIKTPLNKSWSTTPAAPTTSTFSANSRLKKLRDNLKTNKTIFDDSKGELKKQFVNLPQNDYDTKWDGSQERVFNNLEKESLTMVKKCETPDNRISQKNNSVSNESAQTIFNTPNSIQNKLDSTFVSPNSLSSPVNIYKNLDKWITPTNKSSKRGLANERLSRLKKHINNSDKDNIQNLTNTPRPSKCTVTSNNFETKSSNSSYVNISCVSEPTESTVHVSPLLRGLKRSAATEIISECSVAKKVARDSKIEQIYQQPRSMRLVQTALTQGNVDTTIISEDVSKRDFAIPTVPNKNVSDWLKLKDTSTNVVKQHSDGVSKESGTSNFESTDKHYENLTVIPLNNNTKENPSSSTSGPVQPESEYQKKMKMTANWVANHHLVANTQYNPFAESVQQEKPVSITPTILKSSEIADEIEEMEWTNVSDIFTVTNLMFYKILMQDFSLATGLLGFFI